MERVIAEQLEALGIERSPASPTREELLAYVDEAELEGVSPDVAGIVLAAREMARAFEQTRAPRDDDATAPRGRR